MNNKAKRNVNVAAFAFIVLFSVAPGFGAEFYVSHEGKDENPGTKEKPFATLVRARDAVREQIALGLIEQVTVFLRGGTYELSDTLVFTLEDSGTENCSVTYAALPGQSVVVSGGRRITGWKKADANIWTAQVPQVKEGKWYPRQLFVNGRRATRARMPNLGATKSMVQMQDAKVSKDLKSFTVTFVPGIFKNWRSPGDIELVMQGNWAINRKRVESLDEQAGVVHLAGLHVTPLQWNTPRRDRWCFFENARELLDHPGEWYLDRQTGIISYWPRPNEDMTKAQVVAPKLSRLLEVNGTPEQPVRYLHFKGIHFEYADWDLPAGGYMGVQAGHFFTADKDGKRAFKRIDAAIYWDYVEFSRVTDGAIAHMGGVAIALVNGCHRNVIEGNQIYDIGANGVMLGGPRDQRHVPKDNRIANNHIHNCGIDFHGAVGIWTGIVQRTDIAHNRVHDLPYTGISVGWQWNPQPTPCKENTIEYNHIYDVMKQLGDGGGIYTLGFQPGTVIRGNHIHDIHRSAYAQAAPNNGMFIDEGSKGFIFERNVIYKTASDPIRFNQCQRDWHTWKDNSFLTAPPYPQDFDTAGLEPHYRKSKNLMIGSIKSNTEP